LSPLNCIPNHRLRTRILRILKLSKIHEFLQILKLSILKFIKFQLSHLSPPSYDKLFVANAALNFQIKNSVMSTVQDSFTRQQFSTSTSSLLQSPRIAHSFISSQCHNIAVLICPLFPFNSCLSVIDCREMFSTVASVVRIRTHCSYHWCYKTNLYEFLRILKS